MCGMCNTSLCARLHKDYKVKQVNIIAPKCQWCEWPPGSQIDQVGVTSAHHVAEPLDRKVRCWGGDQRASWCSCCGRCPYVGVRARWKSSGARGGGTGGCRAAGTERAAGDG